MEPPAPEGDAAADGFIPFRAYHLVTDCEQLVTAPGHPMGSLRNAYPSTLAWPHMRVLRVLAALSGALDLHELPLTQAEAEIADASVEDAEAVAQEILRLEVETKQDDQVLGLYTGAVDANDICADSNECNGGRALLPPALRSAMLARAKGGPLGVGHAGDGSNAAPAAAATTVPSVTVGGSLDDERIENLALALNINGSDASTSADAGATIASASATGVVGCGSLLASPVTPLSPELRASAQAAGAAAAGASDARSSSSISSVVSVPGDVLFSPQSPGAGADAGADAVVAVSGDSRNHHGGGGDSDFAFSPPNQRQTAFKPQQPQPQPQPAGSAARSKGGKPTASASASASASAAAAAAAAAGATNGGASASGVRCAPSVMVPCNTDGLSDGDLESLHSSDSEALSSSSEDDDDNGANITGVNNTNNSNAPKSKSKSKSKRKGKKFQSRPDGDDSDSDTTEDDEDDFNANAGGGSGFPFGLTLHTSNASSGAAHRVGPGGARTPALGLVGPAGLATPVAMADTNATFYGASASAPPTPLAPAHEAGSASTCDTSSSAAQMGALIITAANADSNGSGSNNNNNNQQQQCGVGGTGDVAVPSRPSVSLQPRPNSRLTAVSASVSPHMRRLSRSLLPPALDSNNNSSSSTGAYTVDGDYFPSTITNSASSNNLANNSLALGLGLGPGFTPRARDPVSASAAATRARMAGSVMSGLSTRDELRRLALPPSPFPRTFAGSLSPAPAPAASSAGASAAANRAGGSLLSPAASAHSHSATPPDAPAGNAAMTAASIGASMASALGSGVLRLGTPAADVRGADHFGLALSVPLARKGTPMPFNPRPVDYTPLPHRHDYLGRHLTPAPTPTPALSPAPGAAAHTAAGARAGANAGDYSASASASASATPVAHVFGALNSASNYSGYVVTGTTPLPLALSAAGGPAAGGVASPFAGASPAASVRSLSAVPRLPANAPGISPLPPPTPAAATGDTPGSATRALALATGAPSDDENGLPPLSAIATSHAGGSASASEWGAMLPPFSPESSAAATVAALPLTQPLHDGAAEGAAAQDAAGQGKPQHHLHHRGAGAGDLRGSLGGAALLGSIQEEDSGIFGETYQGSNSNNAHVGNNMLTLSTNFVSGSMLTPGGNAGSSDANDYSDAADAKPLTLFAFIRKYSRFYLKYLYRLAFCLAVLVHTLIELHIASFTPHALFLSLAAVLSFVAAAGALYVGAEVASDRVIPTVLAATLANAAGPVERQIMVTRARAGLAKAIVVAILLGLWGITSDWYHGNDMLASAYAAAAAAAATRSRHSHSLALARAGFAGGSAGADGDDAAFADDADVDNDVVLVMPHDMRPDAYASVALSTAARAAAAVGKAGSAAGDAGAVVGRSIGATTKGAQLIGQKVFTMGATAADAADASGPAAPVATAAVVGASEIEVETVLDNSGDASDVTAKVQSLKKAKTAANADIATGDNNTNSSVVTVKLMPVTEQLSDSIVSSLAHTDSHVIGPIVDANANATNAVANAPSAVDDGNKALTSSYELASALLNILHVSEAITNGDAVADNSVTPTETAPVKHNGDAAGSKHNKGAAATAAADSGADDAENSAGDGEGDAEDSDATVGRHAYLRKPPAVAVANGKAAPCTLPTATRPGYCPVPAREPVPALRTVMGSLLGPDIHTPTTKSGRRKAARAAAAVAAARRAQSLVAAARASAAADDAETEIEAEPVVVNPAAAAAAAVASGGVGRPEPPLPLYHRFNLEDDGAVEAVTEAELQFSGVGAHVSPWLIRLWQLTSLPLHLLLTSGVALYVCYVFALKVRMRSANRVISAELCAPEHTKARVIDLEVLVWDLTARLNPYMAVILLAVMMKFVSLTFYIVASDPESRYVSRVWEKAYFLFGVAVQPPVLLLLVIFALGGLNSECDFLRKIIARGFIQQTGLEKGSARQAAALMEFTKKAEISPTLLGMHVSSLTALTTLASGVAFYLTMLKYKYRQFI